MNVLALDLSLTSTGWASSGGGLIRPPFGTYRPECSGVRRLADAVSWLDRMLNGWEPDLVVIEGYSFSHGTQAHAKGELGGVIRLHLHTRGVFYVQLPPACRAKLATGKGNASKEQVLVEAVRRLHYGGHSNDEADALWLLQAALIHYELPGAVDVPKSHRDALVKIEWPEMAGLRRAS